ncbi:MAG: hypothetical protein A3H98_04085 [Bacteroidetes bacterium RIFCSPLOWO2_02_FULL_36_8]|nr:MAG: hypothetical protein A3H98_04085 [Bacteroidetes bacterium RIFCSPLOWO2_02_FULL_36_8]OFY68812.1 MAG: hypothetical protein A3G23_03210 [Bacteroidetes bacterium RIFCSPLOWO2_12_FULL_37_12]
MNSILSILLTLFPMFTDGSYSIGEKVQDFTLHNATDKKNVTLSDYKKNKLVVVVFTCNHCPYAKLYEDRLILASKEFSQNGVAFIAINPNDPTRYSEDSEENMLQKAKAKNYPFPYLVNSDQTVSDRFGATKTPEVFVLQNTDGNFVLRYKGAIDDNPQNAADVQEHYLRDALKALLENKEPLKTIVKATGCSIKRKGG